MHVSLVTSVGVVVDGIIMRRSLQPRHASLLAETASQSSSAVVFPTDGGNSEHERSAHAPLPLRQQTPDEFDGEAGIELCYDCKATERPLHQTVFHAMDVLPFGFHSPSNIFSVVGRHTNRGLITAVTSSGLVCVRPYRTKPGGPLSAQYVRARRFKRSLGAEQEIQLNQSWLASVRQESRSASVVSDLLQFLRACDPKYASTAGPGASATPTTSGLPPLPSHRTRSGTPPTPNSTSGFAVAPPTPTRGSPKPAGVGDVPSLGLATGSTPTAHSRCANAGGVRLAGPAAVETYDLRDLSLPPCLSRGRATPPLKVGAQVLARRFGCDRVLHPATVLAVTYDVAYRLHYDADGGIDEGVLHNDVLLVDDSASETCTVRDRVVVALQLQTTVTIVEAMGGGCYRGVLVHDPSEEVEFTTRNLVAVSPLLVDALYASPKHVELFRSLDPTCSGQVHWKNLRHTILHMEHYGKSLSFQTLGEIQRDMCILRGRVEPQMLHKVPVQEEEMALSFNEFEYVLLRALNPL